MSRALSGPSAEPARRFVVSGLVQGVGFRWTTAGLARSLGISGTVRNRPDGTVEIEARAPAEVLDRFREALRTQTPGRVREVRTEALPGGMGPTRDDFRILG